jgi:hypothetical protein
MDDKWERAYGVLPDETKGLVRGSTEDETIVDEDELAVVAGDDTGNSS